MSSSTQLSLVSAEVLAFGERFLARLRERVQRGYADLPEHEVEAIMRIARLEASDLATEAWRAGRRVGRAEVALERAHDEG